MATLEEYIRRSGYQIGHIAEQLFLTRSGLYRKLTGQRGWTQAEMEKLKSMLRITEQDAAYIFYPEKARYVTKN